jgi:hypothetical protein
MLENLNQLAQEAKNKSELYDKNEFLLSDDFKNKFNECYPDFNIVFYDYTSVVTTQTGLLIILPNQWFVLASFFNGYLSALKQYKTIVNELKIDKNTISLIRENRSIDALTENKISENLTVEDAKNFRIFLTDYDWWFGSKTIDRTDYFVSSILNLAGVINNSQSYIADLAYLLSDNTELIEILEKDYNNYLSTTKESNIIITNKVLRQIIFEVFKYILKLFGEDKVLNGYETKDTVIDNRKYKGLLLDKYFGFETLIGMFDLEQTSNDLKSSGTPRFINEKILILGNENSYFTSQWNGIENGRGLSLENFNRFLLDISNNKFKIIKDAELYKLIDISDSIKKSLLNKNSQNVIYYGSPGTGKSFRADNDTKGENVQKVTFHPDYDYQSFVGGYKPTMVDDKIAYKFVPQIFTKIYIDAWKNLVSTEDTKPFYLQIEEINRGNCAEIFGDLFQLLDRNKDGFSKYEVTAEEELRKYLEDKTGFGSSEHDGIKDGKLRFPSNLKIIATMNTSDQSLFPMDSAFKRRWDWIYVPIDTDCKHSNFTIKLENRKEFGWLSFLKVINEEIFEITKSQDKQIGNWFIDAQNSGKVISESTFVNKVIFYLWNDVFKDEENTIFKTSDGKSLTYTSFFEKGLSNNLVSYILEDRLKLTDLNKALQNTNEEM